MHIIVPSYKRSERLLTNVNTLSTISEKWRPHTDLFVREEERDEYLKVAKEYGVNLITFTPSHAPFGWGDTMDTILDMYSPTYERFVTMDDDLDLCWRPGMTSYKKQDDDVFNRMMDDLLTTDEETPVAGILARQFSNNHKAMVEENTRIMQLFSLYGPVFAGRDDRRFARNGPFYVSDIYFTLNMLRNHGKKNRVFCEYVRNDVPNSPGGCMAVGRNPKDHTESLIKIKRAFPTLVDLVEKQNAAHWQGGYLGTRVQWGKAYRHGV